MTVNARDAVDANVSRLEGAFAIDANDEYVDPVFLAVQSVEHYFQAAKFTLFDEAYAAVILSTATPAAAKRAASMKAYAEYASSAKRSASLRITKAAAMRRMRHYTGSAGCAWRAINRDVMRRAIAYKFSAKQNPSLARALMRTGDVFLAEAQSRGGGVWDVSGGNWLGEALMDVRNELFASSATSSEPSASV